jgi:hypothetical protein
MTFKIFNIRPSKSPSINLDLFIKDKTRFLDLLSTNKKLLDCTVENDRLAFFFDEKENLKQEEKKRTL